MQCSISDMVNARAFESSSIHCTLRYPTENFLKTHFWSSRNTSFLVFLELLEHPTEKTQSAVSQKTVNAKGLKALCHLLSTSEKLTGTAFLELYEHKKATVLSLETWLSWENAVGYLRNPWIARAFKGCWTHCVQAPLKTLASQGFLEI